MYLRCLESYIGRGDVVAKSLSVKFICHYYDFNVISTILNLFPPLTLPLLFLYFEPPPILQFTLSHLPAHLLVSSLHLGLNPIVTAGLQETVHMPCASAKCWLEGESSWFFVRFLPSRP